jgi:hypothetical protein
MMMRVRDPLVSTEFGRGAYTGGWLAGGSAGLRSEGGHENNDFGREEHDVGR